MIIKQYVIIHKPLVLWITVSACNICVLLLLLLCLITITIVYYPMPFAVFILNNILTSNSFFMSPTFTTVHTLGFLQSMLSKHMYSMYTCTHICTCIWHLEQIVAWSEKIDLKVLQLILLR